MKGQIRWRKSSYTQADNCVEVAFATSDVAVRDSKDRTGPTLGFGPDEWRTFLDSALST
jgi:hypothetical protein